jgi:hypothetical protein
MVLIYQFVFLVRDVRIVVDGPVRLDPTLSTVITKYGRGAYLYVIPSRYSLTIAYFSILDDA